MVCDWLVMEKMKKILKILLIIVAGFLIAVGLIGGIIELSSEGTDLFGIILALGFIFLGGFILNLGIRSGTAEIVETVETTGTPEANITVEPAAAAEVEELVKKPVEDVSDSGEIRILLWPRTALIIASWVELVFFALGILFALFFGVAGFKDGGMGAMVGIIMVLALIGIAIIVSIRVVALWGLVKGKSWAPVLNLIVSALAAVVLIVSGAWPAVVYTVFTGWCSVYLIRRK